MDGGWWVLRRDVFWVMGVLFAAIGKFERNGKGFGNGRWVRLMLSLISWQTFTREKEDWRSGTPY